MALGDMYGDCRAETNAEDGGDMRDGELEGEDAMELYKFGDTASVIMFVTISLPGLWLELAILMVRDLVSMVEISAPESDTGDCSSMFRFLMMLGVCCENLDQDDTR